MISMTAYTATTTPTEIYASTGVVAPLIGNNSSEFLQCHIGTSPPAADTKNYFGLRPREREDVPPLSAGQKLYVWCLTGTADFVLIIP